MLKKPSWKPDREADRTTLINSVDNKPLLSGLYILSKKIQEVIDDQFAESLIEKNYLYPQFGTIQHVNLEFDVDHPSCIDPYQPDLLKYSQIEDRSSISQEDYSIPLLRETLESKTDFSEGFIQDIELQEEFGFKKQDASEILIYLMSIVLILCFVIPKLGKLSFISGTVFPHCVC